MSSAVQALIDAQTPSLRHGEGGRYRAWCACCASASVDGEARPQRRGTSRPEPAWRTRLAAQPSLPDGRTKQQIEDKKCL